MDYFVNTEFVTKENMLRIASGSISFTIFEIGVLMILVFWLIGKFFGEDD